MPIPLLPLHSLAHTRKAADPTPARSTTPHVDASRVTLSAGAVPESEVEEVWGVELDPEADEDEVALPIVPATYATPLSFAAYSKVTD